MRFRVSWSKHVAKPQYLNLKYGIRRVKALLAMSLRKAREATTIFVQNNKKNKVVTFFLGSLEGG